MVLIDMDDGSIGEEGGGSVVLGVMIAAPLGLVVWIALGWLVLRVGPDRWPWLGAVAVVIGLVAMVAPRRFPSRLTAPGAP